MKFVLVFALFLVFISSCKKNKISEDTLEIENLKSSYTTMLIDNHINATQKSGSLESSTISFSQTFQPNLFTNMKKIWKELNQYINYLGPFMTVKNSTFQTITNTLNNELSMFVINPAYIDQTSENPGSGIIFDEINYPGLTPMDIKNYNLFNNSESNISSGIHALEFILWGEDVDPNGAGTRTMYEFGSSSPDKDRRRLYLVNSSILLNNTLSSLDVNSFKSHFSQSNPKDALHFMLSGVYNFIKYEFAYKAIKRPIDLQSEIYEESPFSDNSLQDLKDKLQSVRNYLYGEQFSSTNGYFLMDYFKFKSNETFEHIDNKLNNINALLMVINIPFDQAILHPNYIQNLNSVHTDLMSICNSIEQFAKDNNLSNLD